MEIHRCRFIPYPPHTITALAFSHTSNPAEKAPSELRLALGRESGDVEIWNPHGGKWFQESILRGSAGKTVDQLAWTQDFEVDDEVSHTIARPGKLRLFSTDGTPAITEWDIAKGTKKRHAEGNFGDLWCFAAQPVYRLPKDGKVDGAPPTQALVGGCHDGSMVLFTTEDDDLRFWKLLAPPSGKKQKILSITWRDRNTVVAGLEDGLIKVIDVSDRRVIRTMTLGKSPDGSKCIVWALKCLPDGTIMSGDSSGELKIWDAKYLSCTQRLKTHQADILDIVSNAKGDLVFTVAVDRRTVAYKPVAAQQGRKSQRWTRLMHRRYHDHDVKCAVAYESKGMSFIVSGGPDTTPVVLPMQNWQSEYHRTLSHLPQRPQMSVSPNARLLLSWWQRDLHIHHITKRNYDGTALSEELLTESHDYEQLATLRLNGDDHIQSARISHDGNLIVASTAAGVRLFQLREVISNGKLSLRTRPIELPNTLRNFGARQVGFSEDGKWLLSVRLDNTIILAKIMAPKDPKESPLIHDRVARLSHKARKQNTTGLGDYSKQINTFNFSPDSRILAIADLSGSIDAWILEGQEDLAYSSSDDDKSDTASSSSDSDSDSDDEDSDSPIIHGQRWTRTPQDTSFPRLDSAILALTFRPSTHPQSDHDTASIHVHATRHTPHPLAHTPPPASTSLVAITTDHTLVELDILTGKLTPWSRRNPSALLPADFTRIRDRIMGVFWDTSHDRQRLWMYGPRWMYMLDLSHDFPGPVTADQHGPQATSAHTKSSPSNKRKRRRSESRTDKGTGAGSHIKPSDRSAIGYDSFAVKYKGTGDEDPMDIVELENRLEPPSDDDDDVPNNALVRLRRGIDQADREDTEMQDRQPLTLKQGQPITHYYTHHYRDIFGVGVLSSPSLPPTSSSRSHNDASNTSNGTTSTKTNPSPASSYTTAHTALGKDVDGDVAMYPGSSSHNQVNGVTEEQVSRHEVEGEDTNTLEIIVVERPLHDIDMPPRFDGGQDWDS